MKVESVEAFPIRIKSNESLRAGTFSYAHYQTVLVKVAGEGEVGWGEAMTRFVPESTALLVRYLGNQLVGNRYGNVKDAWLRLWHELQVRGHTRGTDVEALSGIEIALQDLSGKLSKKPIHALLSGKASRTVPVFAGSLFESRGDLEDQVSVAKESGLAGAKVKIGFGAEKDGRILHNVRRAWDDGMLVADANGAYDSAGAAKACAAFADLDLAWFEEPVLSDDLEGYASLKSSKVRVGAGESWFPDDFGSPIEEKLVGVLEPSVSRCGGVEVEADVARRAHRRGIAFSPMIGMNSAVSLAASIHVASVCPSLGVEYNPFVNPLQTELATGIDAPRGGRIRVPSGIGLGIEVDMRFVKSHSV